MIYRIGCLMIAVLFASCGSGKVDQEVVLNPNSDNTEMQQEEVKGLAFETEELAELFEQYLKVQRALADANPKEVSDQSEEISEMDAGKLIEYAKRMSETDSLPLQQELFSELTHEIGPKLYEGLKNGRIYKYYCPVSSGAGGGYWYAANRGVYNPYAGDEGKNCGTIYEIIRPKKVSWTGSDSGK